ncbi:alpha/beta hydrolase family protein [Alteromonas sp. H39]|uniref:alpha/beta hydrolase family protein n=1 Tax=Alteromonas sp. H39 TaxID=3389876 RepID=UPI0039E159C0
MINLFFLLSLFLTTSAVAAIDVAYSELDFINPDTQQPVKLSIWYPAETQCEGARLCLSKTTRLDQTILLSHGAMGSARELNWIGYATASRGFVTVGINHFGESWVYGPESIQPQAAITLWRRASEVSAVINLLQRNAVDTQDHLALLNRPVNWHNITAIGFSSGGSTVITLAGGRYAPARARDYCASTRSQGDLGCNYVKHSSQQTFSMEEATADYREERITKVIALDPAAGPMTTEKSLANIAIPVMIFAAKQNDFLPFDNHAGYYASAIPNAALYSLDNDAGHFVFIDKCQHNHQAMGISLCEDRSGVDREKVHRQLYPRLIKFIHSGT